MAVVLRLEPLAPSFVEGESVLVRIVGASDGRREIPNPAAPVEGAPVWELAGPSGGFVPIDLRPKLPRGRKAPPPQATVALEAGEREAGVIRLRDLEPGDYRLRARVPAGAPYTVTPEEVPVRIERLRARGLSLGVGAIPSGSYELFGLLLHESATGTALFQTSFDLPHAPGESPAPGSFVRLTTAPGHAREPLCPASNFLRKGAFFTWSGWREGRLLCAHPLAEPAAVRVDLGDEDALVLRPALLRRSLAFEVFVVAQGSLRLVRFEVPRPGAPGAGRTVWSVALPAPVASGTVALEPGEGLERRHVALLTREAVPRLLVATTFDDTPPERWQERRLEGLALLPDSPPGAIVRGESVVVGFVARLLHDPSGLAFAETQLGVARGPSEELALAPDAVVLVPLGTDEEPRACRVVYQPEWSERYPPACVIAGASGELSTPWRPGESRPWDLAAGLEVVALPGGAYGARAERGLVVERL